MNWYINPDSDGQAELAVAHWKASGGKYAMSTSALPNNATQQREQLIR